LERCGRLGEMFEHEAQEDRIEVPVGKGKLEQVCLVELDISVAGSLNSETRSLERGRGNVNRHNVSAGFREARKTVCAPVPHPHSRTRLPAG
jgi:hypothetical protein